MNQHLTVIIVSYNSEDDLGLCVDSIYRETAPTGLQVVVVDNASDDQSFLSSLQQRYSGLAVIRNSHNFGFSKACNQGIQAFPADYYLLLNPDCVVLDRAIDRCLEWLETHQETGILGCRVQNPNGSLQLACRRSIPRPSTAFYRFIGLSRLFPHSARFGRYNYTYVDDRTAHDVEAVSGSFMMFRSELIRQIGPLDEKFFLYGEDLDFCYRAFLRGWRVSYYPQAAVLHHKRKSSSQTPRASNHHFYDAMRIFYRTHYSGRFNRLTNSVVYLGIGSLYLLARLKNRLLGRAEVGSNR